MTTPEVSGGIHDVGGKTREEERVLDLHEKAYAHWERSMAALLGLLVKKGQMSLDEHRRSVEALPPHHYEQQSYYERWASGIAAVGIERGIFSNQELQQELGNVPSDGSIRFHAGDLVRVQDERLAVRWRKPHLRTPGYIFGQIGRVERDCCGLYADPEALAFAEPAARQPMYRVRFLQRHVWEGYEGGSADTVDVEIYQPWLEPATEADMHAQEQRSQELHHGLMHGMVEHSGQGGAAGAAAAAAAEHVGGDHHHAHGHGHGHAHGHVHGDGHVVDHGDHVHEGRGLVELKAAELEADDAPRRKLAEALLRLLTKKGIVTNEEIRKSLEVMDSRGQQQGGARLVAKAWADPDFRARLLQDGNAAAAELGLEGSNWPPRADVPEGCAPKEKYGTVLTIVENTPEVHNLIVCTLCSCYPLSILGMSPSWYKSRAYRSRAVRDPRGVLAEFGLVLPPEVAVRVHDSTADNRYLVLPERPAGTEGWSEARLAELVTRDAMIGVAKALSP